MSITLNPEQIAELKEKIDKETVFSFSFDSLKEPNEIFEKYKEIIEAEETLNEYLDVILKHKEIVSKNTYHTNSRVREVFNNYLKILKELEMKISGQHSKLDNYKKDLIEEFSNNFEKGIY